VTSEALAAGRISVQKMNLDLKTDRESLMRTVCGREFQTNTNSIENWKARSEKSVLVNDIAGSGMADGHNF